MLKELTRKILSSVVKATEGSYRPGPYNLPISGITLPAEVGKFWNWWQLGYDPAGTSSQHAMVEACVSAYAQTVAICPGDHWILTGDGGRERVETSALSRILRHPNTYQSMADFMLNLTRGLYLDGNAYALALRNNRFEISELHLMDPYRSFPQVAPTGDIFYNLAGNDVVNGYFGGTQKLLVPQRDVLHVRLHNGRKKPFPIRGESPLWSALSDIAVGDAIWQQQINYYMNQARPSAVLTTDMNLDRNQVNELRDRWNEQVKSIDCGAGGTPILTNGLKVTPWTSTGGKDTQLAEIAKMSNDRIAMAFRVPQQILGISSGSATNTEALMQLWIATGLGFALNQIEEAFGVTFELWGQPDEYVEFSTTALLRSTFKDRIEGLTRAVQGGIYSPNEARNEEGLDDVAFGDEPRVQQQVVPLSAAASIPTRPGKTPPSPGPEGPPSAAGQEAPITEKPEPVPAKEITDTISRELLFAMDKYERATLN